MVLGLMATDWRFLRGIIVIFVVCLRRLSDRRHSFGSRNSPPTRRPGHQWTYDRFCRPELTRSGLSLLVYDNPISRRELLGNSWRLLDPVTAQL